MVIADHMVVYMDYVLTDGAGQVIEETDDSEPFSYIHGLGQLAPPELEHRLEGLSAGDEREFVLPPEEGFGMPDPDALFWVPRSAFPSDSSPEVGDILMGEDDEGESVAVRVVEVAKDQIKVDANHPLAGETLHYKIKVKEVRQATPEEIEHEHLHDGDEDH